MHRKHGAYYFVSGSGAHRKWIRLGTDYVQSLAAYSRLAGGVEPGETFGELAAEYTRQEFDKLRPATRESYDLALRQLLQAFGNAPVRQIKAHHIGSYMDLRSSIHSANREKAVMSKILQLGVRWGWCDRNVSRDISYHPTKRRKRIITPAEWKQIHLAAPNQLIPTFMDLALVTGLRVGDLLSLRWDQVKGDGLHVLQSKNSVAGIYEMSDSLVSVLERARELPGGGAYIIHTRRGKQYSYAGIRSAWRRVLATAGLEGIQIHDIRRTAITRAKQAGIRVQDFSLHRTEREALAYVIEVPKVRPLDLIR